MQYRGMIKKIKYFLLGHYIQNPQIKLAKKWFGGKYGGFYVHPSELNENSIKLFDSDSIALSFHVLLMNAFCFIKYK